MSWIAYEKIDGRCWVVCCGKRQECVSHVSANPSGPRGGSTHVRSVR